MKELSYNELMATNGGGVTLGSLLVAMGLGGLTGSFTGAQLGSAVAPGAGTVAGALSGFVWGAGNAALAHIIQNYGAERLDQYLGY
ncbi:class IIb bacteriocin, lactobin A/cerein 7B family [Clostridium aceticum]|uniref:class IIb bacteriocin, lactobin A/cerein 7B family n=1 Tax=Clostridium aceticum TaxID=84022 RepID=UPI001187613A|nr:class IIb bacteriocin, lactobin A/cerein 7B family [Clostridium aceticum]